MEERSDKSLNQNQSYHNITLFYYTGTGNSLWAARILAQELGNTELISLVDWDKKGYQIDSSVVGMIFPVHIWGVPRRVLDFLDDLQTMSTKYIFAVATNGGQVSNTLAQLKKIMESKSLTLSSGWSIVLPSNYIPWGGPGSLDEQNNLFKQANVKLLNIAQKIRDRVDLPVEMGPLWQRIIFTWIYKLTFPMVHEMDNKFWADERCNKCNLCAEICPTQNIAVDGEKLIWHSRCEQCLRCIQWCPQQALQYGQKTLVYSRYHHPEIKVKDIMK